jgi:hypothetical protein
MRPLYQLIGASLLLGMGMFYSAMLLFGTREIVGSFVVLAASWFGGNFFIYYCHLLDKRAVDEARKRDKENANEED